VSSTPVSGSPRRSGGDIEAQSTVEMFVGTCREQVAPATWQWKRIAGSVHGRSEASLFCTWDDGGREPMGQMAVVPGSGTWRSRPDILARVESKLRTTARTNSTSDYEVPADSRPRPRETMSQIFN